MKDEPLETGITVRLIKPRRPSEAERRSAGVRAMRAIEKRRGAPVTRFKRIMAFARDLAADDSKALPWLITALGRIVQSQAIVEPTLHYPRDVSSSAYSPDTLFFPEFEPLDAEGRTFRDVAWELKEMRELRLDRDIIIAWPWQPHRLMMSLSKLRPHGGWGRWKQEWNHQVELWEPIGIGFVHGGNHSIAAGVLTASGKIKPDFGYDLTPVYDHVVCNGREFRRKQDKGVIAEAASVEMAAIFEIGRLMVEIRNQRQGSSATPGPISLGRTDIEAQA